MPTIVTTRRVSAGISPDPGSTSTLPAWWGKDDWTEAEVRGALDEHPDVCREHHVAPDTVLAVARGMAEHADHATGRGCRPTNARLVELLRVSLSTVQRARRVLKALKLCAQVVAGRSVMTRTERLAAWRRGSSHRNVAAEFVLTSRRDRSRAEAREVRTLLEPGGGSSSPPQAGPRRSAVDDDTPPGSRRVSTSLASARTFFSRKAEKNDDGGAPRHSLTRDLDKIVRPRGGDPAARRLAERTRGRLWWLRGVSARRLTPTLTRFARAGWTERDVDLATRDEMTRRGWGRVPADLKQPAAYLAGLLRDLDPADRPTAAEAAAVELERRENAHRLLLAMGTPCAHGVPAGNVPSPLRRHLACPECRQAAEGAEWVTVGHRGATGS